MKNPLKRSNPIDVAEEQLGKFRAALERQLRRRAVVADIIETQKARRRDYIGEHPGEEIPIEIRQAISVALDDARTTEEEIADYQAHISRLERSLAEVQDKARREAAAAELEALAVVADQFGAEVEKATKLIATAWSTYNSRMPPEMELVDADNGTRRRLAEGGWYFTSAELAAAVVAEFLARADGLMSESDAGWGRSHELRRLFDIENSPQFQFAGPRPAPVRDPAKALISDRLRDRAGKIRAGEIDPASTAEAA